jgi:expansin (peptidoglycan-binding protein)
MVDKQARQHRWQPFKLNYFSDADHSNLKRKKYNTSLCLAAGTAIWREQQAFEHFSERNEQET